MKTEILSEIDQMKYLFGYKAGKVISEQVMPAQQQGATGGLKQFFDILLDSIQKGVNYVGSPLTPDKIIVNPQLTYNPSKQEGSISYYEYSPSEKSSVGVAKSIPFYSSAKSQDELYSQKDNVKLSQIKDSNFQTKPMDMAELIFVVNADKNPKAFSDFVEQMNPQYLEFLKKSLVQHMNSVSVEGIMGSDGKAKLKQIYDIISKA